MNRKHKTVTIKDVADAAGVSTATVSRALNSSESVSPDTYQRILSAINHTGYEVKASAGESEIILFFYPESNTIFYEKVVQGFRESVATRGFLCVASTTGDELDMDSVNNVCRILRPRGVVFGGPIRYSDYIKMEYSCPIVQCCEYDNSINTPLLTVDNYQASRTAVEYLISRGKKRIGMMNSSLPARFSQERYRGYCDALTNAGLNPDPRYIYTLRNVSSYDVAFSVASNFLSLKDHPDAIFAVSDVCGVAIVNVANKLGISIPDDMAVIGFDNTYVSRLCSPELTTVSQQRVRMGNVAGELLLEHVFNPLSENLKITLDTELIIRGTT